VITVSELRTNDRARTAAHCLLVAGGYYVGGRIGLALTPHGAAVSTLWPPNAILMGALLQSSTRTWPLLLAAVLPAHLVAELHGGVPLSMVLSWYVSNCAEALLGAWIIRRIDPTATRFRSIRGLVVFLIGGAFAAPFLSSFLDAAFVQLNNWGSSGYWNVWGSRLLGNVIAVLTIVPAMVTPSSGLRAWRASRRAWRAVEAAALAIGLVTVCVLGFLHSDWGVSAGPALSYAPLPFLLWAALRFGPASVSAALFGVSLISIWGTISGHGPFAAAGASVMPLQLFLILTDVPILALTAFLAERVAAADRSERTATQLRVALRVAGMGAWDWDMRSNTLELSDEYAAFYGLDRSELPRSPGPLIELSEPADRSRLAEAMRTAMERGTSTDIEFRIRRKDGATRWLRTRGAVIRDAGGQAIRMVGVGSDETDRHEAEAESLAQRRELAHLGRVAVLGELSGALAHELKQPLTAILANTRAAQGMLRRYMPDEAELRAILDDIVADDLLASAVLPRVRKLIKKGTTEPTAVGANDVVYEVLDLAHVDLRHRGVHVVTHLASDLPPVTADRIQLQQVLLNLIVNACDAMMEKPPSERVLSISTGIEDHSVCIQVGDRGTGISQDAIDSVFEPFMTTKEQGLGLGLSICRSIITAHGGRIWATNNPDQGATLHLSLPAATHAGVFEPSA